MRLCIILCTHFGDVDFGELWFVIQSLHSYVVSLFLILGENAVIEYRWVDDSVVDLYHTEVPPSYRGKGLAQLLAKVNFLSISLLQHDVSHIN